MTLHSSRLCLRLLAFACSLIGPLAAQTNTFPGSGNVGIGTAIPLEPLDVRIAPNLHFGVFSHTANAASIGAFNDGFTAWHSLSINPGGQVWFMGGNVGIGTTNPTTTLHISSVLAPSTGLTIENTASGGGSFAVVVTQNGAAIGGGRFSVYDRVALAHRLTVNSSGNVGIGTTNPTNKLEVNGTIRAKEVVVETTGWSDYVFAPDYRLAPLSEVEAHIQSEGTLPGIPSAAEVAEHGVSLGDMQAKLLAKLEEMTLRQIAQEKEIQRLRAEVAVLKSN
jgi:hypothetical protein